MRIRSNQNFIYIILKYKHESMVGHPLRPPRAISITDLYFKVLV